MSGIHTVKALSPIQTQIWLLARTIDGHRPTHQEIAEKVGKTRSFVSKILKSADLRVEHMLRATAEANWIKIEGISVEAGFLWGKSQIFGTTCYVTFSPSVGVQVWYDHPANCATCEIRDQCIKTISAEASARGIELPRLEDGYTPAHRAEFLFTRLRRLIENAKKESRK